MTEPKPAYLIERPGVVAITKRPAATLTTYYVRSGVREIPTESVQAEWFKATPDGRLEFFIGMACVETFQSNEWESVARSYDWD